MKVINNMMNKSKVWLKCYNYILMGVIAFICFSCSSDEPGEDPNDENHKVTRPYVQYHLEGNVYNTRNQPLSGIQVIIGEVLKTPYSEEKYVSDTIYSDAQGAFSYREEYASVNSELRVICRSIDKNGNVGIYKTDSVDVDMGEPHNSSGVWNKGEAYQKIQIILKEK